ncbi:hypothetical protein HX120_13790 [Acinetobacter indicus]|nr:hypothetical protein [Acinetobacter indicus]
MLSFVIAVSPIILINSANAANVGGWTLGGGVAQGASTVYDATKNVLINGKKFIKESSVKITPNASQVAKVLARGAAGYALSVAVEQLLGSVDWVLDPENNRIIYDGSPTGYIYTIVSYGGNLNVSSPDYTSACKKAMAAFITIQSTGGDTYTTSNMQASPTLCSFDYHIKQYTYSERLTVTQTEVNEEPKSLPLETVAAQVISNAESDTEKRPAAQVATTAAAADIVAEAEKDDSKARPIASQAEANATTKPADAAEAENAGEAAGTSKPNTTNPEITDISLEFPIFCNWAPTVCEAAQTVISFPRTLTDWWNTSNEKADSWVMSITEAWASVRDWATTEKQNDSTEIEIEKPQQETVDTDISFNASCPAPYTLASFTAFGSSHNWTIDFSEMCSAITTFVRPVVIAMGALSAALIIGGVRDNG